MDETQSNRKARRSQKKLKKSEQKQKAQQKAMINKVLSLGIGLSILAGIIMLVMSNRVPIPEGAGNRSLEQVTSTDWTKGSATASAVLIEYSDFQCPACKAYVPFIEQVIDELGDQVIVAYRHFPLKRIHLQAELAAQGAHAAGKQDKFWEMHDLLFENQEDWSQNPRAKKLIEGYAESLNLDMDQFNKDFTSKDTKGWVKSDLLDGLTYGINSTPTFFLNGEKITNPASYESFKQLLTGSLNASSSASPAATME